SRRTSAGRRRGPRPRSPRCAARPTLLLLLEAPAPPLGRCQFSRRAWEDESSHRTFKFATTPAILRRVGGFAASLQAFGRVFSNPRVRNLQLAGAGSTLGVWAYGVALPVYAYHSGGTRAVGLLFLARLGLGALAGPWIGVIADRWSRRRVMLTSDLSRCAIFAGMTAVSTTGGNA